MASAFIEERGGGDLDIIVTGDETLLKLYRNNVPNRYFIYIRPLDSTGGRTSQGAGFCGTARAVGKRVIG